MHRRLPLVSTVTCRISFSYIKSACLPIKFGSLALRVDSMTIPRQIPRMGDWQQMTRNARNNWSFARFHRQLRRLSMLPKLFSHPPSPP